MTKTITDFHPLIYAHLFAQPEKRRLKRHHLLAILRWLFLPVLYLAISLTITVTTGVPPWNWRFLLMFTPVFFVGEQAFAEICRHWSRE